ncbi:succinate dehydrogenase, cytochrome b556 subunit [Halorhodospira halophila]|uniref:Succinate dehydrogenase cytochrome b556 subunit n=1 Tax=Halorhodospira halophila (strain DSM 244 / SL1) TaxID=349124 RepID=A1WT29_HALHL|nr:succinate dehydrogenase, cytochrome b556 subunit [Halorhodospira halophila]ABM60841.1 succinate dehydrogenase subunit C [Halorhodospira halophila SL1]MBK1728496.1 succinate dehydrogenase, cytochrome b556 subunit [Halorhodospira halophila]
MRNPNRPLSPHLTIYRPQLTSLLSVLHRGTGVFVTMAAVLLVAWVMALAAGPEYYELLTQVLGHWLGQLVLLGITFSLAYHLCNGIRHLVWDTVRAFELKAVYRGGYMVLAASVLLTALVWVIAYAGEF